MQAKIWGRFLNGAALAGLGVALAGCMSTVPDSGARSGSGVGFAGYSASELREAQRAAGSAARDGSGPWISNEAVAPAAAQGVAGASGNPVISAGELAQAGIPVEQTQPVAAVQPQPQPQPGAAPVGSGQLRMSDEQDFDAVAGRESIASDQERLNQNRAAYREVAPEALPGRTGQSNTRVIDFALATSNPVGQKQYDRPARQNIDKFNRACARYPSQDVAQDEFLRAGGPQRDSKGVDPDGDGFACFWDPTPFRLARQGAVGAPQAREVLPGQLESGALGAGGVQVRTSQYDQTPLQ